MCVQVCASRGLSVCVCMRLGVSLSVCTYAFGGVSACVYVYIWGCLCMCARVWGDGAGGAGGAGWRTGRTGVSHRRPEPAPTSSRRSGRGSSRRRSPRTRRAAPSWCSRRTRPGAGRVRLQGDGRSGELLPGPRACAPARLVVFTGTSRTCSHTTNPVCPANRVLST